MLAIERSVLKREYILINVLNSFASIISACNPLIEDYTETLYMSDEGDAMKDEPRGAWMA
jgi:hypothetical protein